MPQAAHGQFSTRQGERISIIRCAFTTAGLPQTRYHSQRARTDAGGAWTNRAGRRERALLCRCQPGWRSLLRIMLVLRFPAVVDDSRLYADIAKNWLQHGVYGITNSGTIMPTLSRLPGYPTFLAVIFAIFGTDNFRAVLLVQVLFDLATCFLDRRSGAPDVLRSRREGCISVGCAVPVPGELRRRRAHGNPRDFLHNAGVQLRVPGTGSWRSVMAIAHAVDRLRTVDRRRNPAAARWRDSPGIDWLLPHVAAGARHGCCWTTEPGRLPARARFSLRVC